MENLESEEVKFRLVKEFLLELRKKFGERDEKLVKVAKLRKIEEVGRIMKEFV